MIPEGRVGSQWVWVHFHIVIYRLNSLKIFWKNQLSRKGVTCVEALSGKVDLSLFKTWSPGIRWGHNLGRGNCYMGKNQIILVSLNIIIHDFTKMRYIIDS